MAELNNIEVSYSRKVQLERYEPVEHFVSMDISLGDEEDEDIDELYDKYAAWAEDMVERTLAERIAEKKLEDTDDE